MMKDEKTTKNIWCQVSHGHDLCYEKCVVSADTDFDKIVEEMKRHLNEAHTKEELIEWIVKQFTWRILEGRSKCIEQDKARAKS
jgi:hypothetical protein